MPPRVSVITPAYNAAPWISETIRSVLAQEFMDWEMIVADDGSTDDTTAVARAAADGDTRLYVEPFPHSGLPATARNRALARAQGAYIAFLDADDLWEREKIAAQVKQLDNGARWAFANSRFFGGGASSPEGLKYPSRWRPKRPFFPALLTGEGVPFATVIVRRELLEQIAPDGRIDRVFDESPELKAVEDWDLTLRLARIAEPVYTPEVLARYRAHAAGVSKSFEENHRRTMALIAKHEREGADGALCTAARRFQRSKRGVNRMMHGGGPWRGDLLATCTSRPLTARNAVLGLLPLMPDALARRVYTAALGRQRRS